LKQSLDELLRNPVGNMNDTQKNRFDLLRARYSGVVPATIPQKTDTVFIVSQPIIETIQKVEHITVIDTVTKIENVGIIKVENSFQRNDTTVVIHEYHAPTVSPSKMKTETRESKPKARVERKPVKMMLALSAAFAPDFSFGGAVGLGGQNFGGYIKARSNFKNPGFDYEQESVKPIWTSGSESFSRTTLTAGAYFRIAGNFRLYAGAGYGENGLYFQDVNGSWARISDYSSRGLSFDLGGYYDIGRLRIILGASTTEFKYYDFEAGVGIVLF